MEEVNAFVEQQLARVDDFRFVEGVTPLSSLPFVATVIALFLILVKFGFSEMEKRKPEMSREKKQSMKLKALFFLHNSILCIFSFVLLVAMAVAVAKNWIKHDFFWVICAPGTQDVGAFHLLYYINFLGKLYELLDTFFLILKGKKPDFLQVYHHAATFFLTWIQMVHWTAVQWIPITANLTVHVVMYLYYALTTLGIHPRWKVWVTVLQIVQFVADIGFISYCFYHLLVHNNCQGDRVAAYVAFFIIGSYLLLFLELFYRLYIKRKPAAAATQDKKKKK